MENTDKLIPKNADDNIVVSLTPEEIKELKLIKNYFSRGDKTLFEQRAYSVLNKIIKKTK